jgi:tRNA threonylcarbamoyladenosine modification (KEOPS) complex  Pcc1 subunit
MILTLQNYKANFCIFLNDLCNFEKSMINKHQVELKQKILHAIYSALKGDIYSSPSFDTTLNISIKHDHIVIYISSNDRSKFLASILSFLRLINLVCLTLFAIV